MDHLTFNKKLLSDTTMKIVFYYYYHYYTASVQHFILQMNLYTLVSFASDEAIGNQTSDV